MSLVPFAREGVDKSNFPAEMAFLTVTARRRLHGLLHRSEHVLDGNGSDPTHKQQVT